MAYISDQNAGGLDTLDNITLANSDLNIVGDVSDSNRAKAITWTNTKTFLKTYFDTLYPSGSGTSTGINTGDDATNSQYSGLAASKQDTLISATNIKTVGGISLLGSGNVAVGTGTVTTVSVVTANGISGSVATDTTTPAITLTLGAITPTTVNGLTITSNGTNTLHIAAGKTLRANNTLIFAGTDSTTMTFPTTSATIARTDAANTFTGASTALAWILTSPTITTGITPTSNDGAALGTTALQFSDLFLAEGGVINWDNGDATLTQVADVVTLAGADLKITTPGNAATSVLTTDGTQTITNKTLSAVSVLADAAQISLTVPSADATATGFVTSAFNSGYSSTAVGDLVYLDASATWQKVDADAVATCKGLMGIALTVAASGASVKIALPGSFVRLNAWAWTVGATLYAGETPAAMQETIPTGADAIIRVVGFAVNADYIYFYPSQDQQSTVA